MASFSNLPPMPPALIPGSSYVMEHHNSPSRAHQVVVEHRVHRSPFREVFVQEKHHDFVAAARISGPPPHMAAHYHSQMVVRHPPEHHQDLFISALQCEVNELKNRQCDYGALMDVYKQMEIKVHEAFLGLQTMQMEQSSKID